MLVDDESDIINKVDHDEFWNDLFLIWKLSVNQATEVRLLIKELDDKEENAISDKNRISENAQEIQKLIEQSDKVFSNLTDVWKDVSVVTSDLSIRWELEEHKNVMESELQKSKEENTQLIERMNEVDSIIRKVSQERDEKERRIISLSSDLEQHIDESIELNQKLAEFSNFETRVKASLISLIKNIDSEKEISDTSLSSIMEELHKLMTSMTNISYNSSESPLFNESVRTGKLEQEEAYMTEVNKLEMLQYRNNDLQMQIYEITRSKESSDNEVANLELEITNLSVKLESTLKSMEKNLYKSEELEKFNKSLVESSKILNEEIVAIKMKAADTLNENETYKEALILATGNLSKSQKDLINAENMLISLRNDYDILEAEKRKCEDNQNDMKQQIFDISMQNENLINARDLKILHDDLEAMTLKFEKVFGEKENYEKELVSCKCQINEFVETAHIKDSVIINKEHEITSMKKELENFEIMLNDRLLELETALEDCLQLNEELELSKSINVEKEEQLERIHNELRSCKIEIENEKIEKENIENDFKIKISVLEKEYSALSDRNEIKEKLDNIEVKFLNVEEELKLVKEEKIKLSCDVNNLEKELSNLNESMMLLTVNIHEKEKEFLNKEAKIEELQNVIELINQKAQSDMESMERKISEVMNELGSLTLKESQMALTIEQFKIDISLKDEVISEISSKLKSKEDELKYFSVQCIQLEEHESILREKEEILKEFKKNLELKNNEVLLYTNELSSLRISLTTVDDLRRKVEENESKIEVYEHEISMKDFDIISADSKWKLLDQKNKHLTQQVIENMHSFTKEKIKNKSLLSEIRILRETQDTNSVESKSLIDNLTKEKEKLLAQCVKYEKDLKDHKSPEMGLELNSVILELSTNINVLDTKLKAVEKDYEEAVRVYEDLKVQYLKKRKTTETLKEKYSKLLKFIKEKGLDVPKGL